MKITRTTTNLLFATGLMSALALPLQAQSTNSDFQRPQSTNAEETLKQYVADLQTNPSDTALREKIIRMAADMNPPPPLPEEARKHFVMGTTLFKDAKTPDDYSQVESEFKQATDLAPQWPEARYNRALACEAAGKYADAIEQFKLYQLFKLSADDARMVQDKIYVLEAKEEKEAKAANAAAQEARAVAQKAAEEKRAEAEATAAQMEGMWYDSTLNHTIEIRRDSAGNYSFRDMPNLAVTLQPDTQSVKVSGRTVKATVFWRGTTTASDYNLTLFDDGQKLVGTQLNYNRYNRDGDPTKGENDCTFHRR